MWRFVFSRELGDEQLTIADLANNPTPEEFNLLGLEGGTIDL